MLTHSQNVALTPLDFSNYQNALLDVLWSELTESAIEPMQAPVPYLINFAEDCLLCAIVVLRRHCVDQASSDFFPSDEEVSYEEEPIGLVYVTAAPAQNAAQEANVGIIISECYQRKGFAREAVELALKWAFEDLKFHRIQAAFMNNAQKDRAMRLFVGQGFAHEGTRRRSVFQPERGGVVGVWKDVTYLAMLDTEWALRNVLKHKDTVPTLWDEMFARHARERDEMVKWDEKHNRIRKVSSTETLRDKENPRQQPADRAIIDAWPSDMSSSSCQSSSYGSVPPSPNPGAADISKAMREYLDFRESHPRWSPSQELDDVSRQSSPSPYDFYIPSESTPILDPPRSPSVPSSVSEFESEDESDVAPSWRALRRIPASGSQLSWTQRPLIPTVISRPGSAASGSSDSESWSDASAGDGVDGSDGSEWDMMSEPERSS